MNSNYVIRLRNFYTSYQGLITIAVSSYNRLSCLQPLFLFTIFVLVYNPCSCLQQLFLFTTVVLIHNPCSCLQSLFLFTIFVLVHNPFSCLQSLFLFTILVLVHNPCSCLQYLFLFTTLVLVYNPCSCLQSLFFFTILVLVYNRCSCLQPLFLFTILCSCLQSGKKEEKTPINKEFGLPLPGFPEGIIKTLLEQHSDCYLYLKLTVNLYVNNDMRPVPGVFFLALLIFYPIHNVIFEFLFVCLSDHNSRTH